MKKFFLAAAAASALGIPANATPMSSFDCQQLNGSSISAIQSKYGPGVAITPNLPGEPSGYRYDGPDGKCYILEQQGTAARALFIKNPAN